MICFVRGAMIHRGASAAFGLVCILLVSAGCASPIHETSDPASGAWRSDSDLARLRDVLVHIDRQYVDPPNFSLVVVAAVQALADHLPADRVSVKELATEITIECRKLGDVEYTLRVPRNAAREDAIRAIMGIYRAPCAKSSHDAGVLEQAMIVAALKRLDDDSSFSDRDQFRRLRSDAPDGTVGMTLTVWDKALVVHGVTESTPADRAGLRRGDSILQIDGLPTTLMSPSEAYDRLRGGPRTTVTVTVWRSDWSRPRDVLLTRELVDVWPVVMHRLPGDLGYIGLRTLTDDTHKALDQALGDLGTGARTGLILDLRDNPGGLLTAAVLVAEKFLEEAKLVTYTEGRGPKQNMRFSARPTRPYDGFVGRWTYTTAPMAVLVNEATSSGAEIIAGALQDWERAVLFGTRTPGRTSIQTVIPLSDGSAVKLTTARWFTPRGRSLGKRGGLVPDVSVDTSASVTSVAVAEFAATLPRDAVVQAAVNHLRGLAAPKP